MLSRGLPHRRRRRLLVLALLSCAAGGAARAQSPAPATTLPFAEEVSEKVNAASFFGRATNTDDPATPTPTPAFKLMRVGVKNERPLPLSLQDALRLALDNNNDIEVARGDVRLGEVMLRSLDGIYEPLFQFNPRYSNSVTPTASTLGGANKAGSVTRASLELDTSVTKLMRTGGGQYQVFYNTQRETSSSSVVLVSPLYLNTVGVQVTQPLLRDRSIDKARRDIRIQRKRLEQSDSDFRRLTTDVIVQVQHAYWDLVFALRDQQNRAASLNLVRQQLRETEDRISSGATAPLERTEVQAELSTREADVLLAKQSVTLAENNLKRLLLRDSTAPEWAMQLLPTDEPPFDAERPILLDEALAEARANRPILNRLRLDHEISDIDLKYLRNQTRPRVDLQATVATTGLAGSPTLTPGTQLPRSIPENFNGGYGKAASNLFTLDTRSFSVGVTVQFPLRNKTAQANLEAAQIQRAQLAAALRSEIQLVEVEVRNSAEQVETARRRVLAARTARENADSQLAGEKQLYQVGRSSTFLLLQRESQLSSARSLELRAQIEYGKALATLQQATASTLTANHVFVDAEAARD
ncbi:MAG TPA: TolC family protein [Pyrinomonadaceae bacterium]